MVQPWHLPDFRLVISVTQFVESRVVGLGEALRGGQVVLGWNHDPGSVSVREYGCHLRTMYGKLLPLA